MQAQTQGCTFASMSASPSGVGRAYKAGPTIPQFRRKGSPPLWADQKKQITGPLNW